MRWPLAAYRSAGRRLPTVRALSDGDRITCSLLTAALASAPQLAERLAVAGRTGTLKARFVGTPVAGRLHAKTGSLDRISALAGFADNRAGERLAFSYIVNDLPHGESGRELQDAVARALVTVSPDHSRRG